MPIQSEYFPYTLHFTFDAGTSRGVLKEKTSWFICLTDVETGTIGWGEAGPLPGLSQDNVDEIPSEFKKVSSHLRDLPTPESVEEALALASEIVSSSLPSVRFALEMALLQLISPDGALLPDNRFFHGGGIPINGLIWMGNESFMRDQFNEKLNKSFGCFKMKIGALGFENELKTLAYIRQHTDAILRVDANGAFSIDEAMDKLSMLEPFNLHSIEQPIAPGQSTKMAALCEQSPIPIALDEELIGVTGKENRRKLLEDIQPQYIILKPTLVGGITDTREWVGLAEELGIGWWITSALESNIGLNAICQLTASLNFNGHQGLGTGQLYSNNVLSPLEIHEGHIFYRKGIAWSYPSKS